MKIFKQMLALGLALVMSQSANATLISVNGITVEALDLNGSYSSFGDFYDFNNANRFASDTGLEQADRIVMFFAELESEFAFFSLVSGVGGGSGGADINISGTQGLLSFVDDAPEKVSDTNVSWVYGSNRGDGLIYSGLSADGGWSLDFIFSNLDRIDGFDLLTFNDGSFDNANSAMSSDVTDYRATATAVSEPASIAVFGSLLIGLSLLRRKI